MIVVVFIGLCLKIKALVLYTALTDGRMYLGAILQVNWKLIKILRMS